MFLTYISVVYVFLVLSFPSFHNFIYVRCVLSFLSVRSYFMSSLSFAQKHTCTQTHTYNPQRSEPKMIRKNGRHKAMPGSKS